jgi:hypothetical protein
MLISRARSRCIKPRFASANHTLHTKALKLVNGRGSISTSTQPRPDRSTRRGAYKMRDALEINFALWGMMLCAAVQVAQHFEVY